MQRAAVIVNPSKFGDLDRLRTEVTAVFREAGWAEPLWLETTVEDPGTGQAEHALAAGVDLICPLGGDGTVRCVATALRASGIAMGLLPAGTGNLLARNLGVPVGRRYADAVRRALHGHERDLDLGIARIDRTGEGVEIEEHVFTVMCGIGLEADMLGGTPERLKARLGWLAYVLASIRHLRARPIHTTVVADDQERLSGPTTTVIVGNCGALTGGVRLMPGALPDDGLLDAVVLTAGSFSDWGRLVFQVLGRRSNDVQVRHLPARRLEVTAAQPRTVQLDGDILGSARRLTVEVDPGALRVRVP